MNESSIFSKYETFDYYGHEFDYESDFKQFLAEAKKNTNNESYSSTHLKQETKKQLNEEKKNKKSWKKSLFSWLKTGKKSKFTEGLRNGTTKMTKTVRGHYSGPVQGSRRSFNSGRAYKPASGPLTGVKDYDVPYMCLGKFSNSQRLSYGPIYLVT